MNLVLRFKSIQKYFLINLNYWKGFKFSNYIKYKSSRWNVLYRPTARFKRSTSRWNNAFYAGLSQQALEKLVSPQCSLERLRGETPRDCLLQRCPRDTTREPRWLLWA